MHIAINNISMTTHNGEHVIELDTNISHPLHVLSSKCNLFLETGVNMNCGTNLSDISLTDKLKYYHTDPRYKHGFFKYMIISISASVNSLVILT